MKEQKNPAVNKYLRGAKVRVAAARSAVERRVRTYSFGNVRLNRQTESSDMLLYLAGVNEHAVLRIVGSKRWSVAHFLRTVQYLSNTELAS